MDVVGEESVGGSQNEELEGVDFRELAERLGHGGGGAKLREEFMRAAEKSLAQLGVNQADDGREVCAARRQGVAAFIQRAILARLGGEQVRDDIHERRAAALVLDDGQFAPDDGNDAACADTAEKDVPKALGRGGGAG